MILYNCIIFLRRQRKEIFGKFEAYYLQLDEIQNLDVVFNDKSKWNVFDSFSNTYNLLLFNFRCLDNKPSIFEFIIKRTNSINPMYEGNTYYYITKFYNDKEGNLE